MKRILCMVGALILIFWGGAGTQSQSMLAQGAGFLGLLIGLVFLFIFGRMFLRALGCLPALLAFIALALFLLFAVGAFSNGIGGVGNFIKSFLGRSDKQIAVESDGTIRLAENFAQPASQTAPDKEAKENKQLAITDLPEVISPAKVINGDTLYIYGKYFKLYGIDAPEPTQTCADGKGRSYRCGQEAANWLKSWIEGYELNCRIMGSDNNGNMLGVCFLGQYDVAAALVNAGWAIVEQGKTNIYSPYEQQAQNNKVGLWQGKFYNPWDWRKLQNQKPKIKINRPKKKSYF